MSESTVTIIDNRTGKSVDLPIQDPTLGVSVVDIRSLFKEIGYFTYDPGFMATASCKSAITYLDGPKGELSYRGYPIEQLAEHCSFLEVCYLLLRGELPNTQQLSEFEYIISHHTMLNKSLRKFFDGFQLRRPSNGHDDWSHRLAVSLLPRYLGHTRP